MKKVLGFILFTCLWIMALTLLATWPRPATKEKPAASQRDITLLNVECEPHPCASAATGTAITNGSPWIMGTAVTSTIDPIAALRAEAHKRGLKWIIFCAGEGSFAGWAVGKYDLFEVYVEQGAKPHWLVINGKTQSDAAKKLLTIIQGKPNMIPDHEPTFEHKQCPPEISGN